MNTYLGEGRISTERRDCVVIAMAYALKVDYITAHKHCASRGRKPGRGMPWKDAFDLNDSYVSELFGHVISRQTVPYRLTLDTFKRMRTKGTFLVRQSGHLSVLKDGEYLNGGYNGRCHVKEFAIVTPIKK